MTSDAVAAVRAAVAAINDRSIGDRAAELLDPSFVRHDLAELFGDSQGPATSIGLAVAAGGAFGPAKITRLLSGQEWIESLRKAQGSQYRPAR